MKTIKRPLLAFLCTAAFAAAQAPYAFHFEFDQTGVLPDATPGVAAFNLTGSPTPTLFNVNCGVMVQQTVVNPTLGAGFYNGLFGGYPASGTGMNPALPAFIEAEFKLIGGTGGPGTIPNSTGVMGIFPGGDASLIVNVVTGDVGLNSTGGVLWFTPPGTAFTKHTYRISTIPTGTGPLASLYIDGAPVFLFVPQNTTAAFDGFYIGDSAGSPFISTLIEWSYVSVGQTPDGPGQANSQSAALFVNRSNTTSVGQMGLKGPFYSSIPGGSTMTLEWNGPALAPFALFVGPQNPANSFFGCVGILDIATPPGYADLQLWLDPFNPYTGFLFWTDACGKAKQTFSIPPWLPGTPIGNFQGAVFQPSTSSCPVVLTAAHYVTT